MFKITWDIDNNGVKLTMRSTDETLNVSPRHGLRCLLTHAGNQVEINSCFFRNKNE